MAYNKDCPIVFFRHKGTKVAEIVNFRQQAKSSKNPDKDIAISQNEENENYIRRKRIGDAYHRGLNDASTGRYNLPNINRRIRVTLTAEEKIRQEENKAYIEGYRRFSKNKTTN